MTSELVSSSNAAVIEKEASVGINVFVQPQTLGFQCVVKQRFTDFLVNEILPDGTVLHYTEDNGKRKREADEASEQSSTAKKARTENNTTEAISQDVPSNNSAEAASTKASIPDKPKEDDSSISESDGSALKNIFGDSTTSAILKLYSNVLKNPGKPPRSYPTVESEPIPDKSTRTDAHNVVRRVFKSKLQTLTLQDQSQHSGPGTIIAVKAASANPQSRSDEKRTEGSARGKHAWNDLGGEYLHFTLYKENKDTMEVLYFIASQLKMHVKHFTVAGTKDRRGVTVQRVAAHRVHMERLQGLNRMARGWRLGGPWEYKKEGLQLGMLQGNEFVLTLRSARFDGEQPGWTLQERIQHAEKVTSAATTDFNKYGYLNYFGMQRFGTHSIGTHIVGMRMLKGDLEGAVNAILDYDPSLVAPDLDLEGKKIPRDDVQRASAIHAFRNNESMSDLSSKLSGSRYQAEKNILTHLSKRDRATGKRPNETDFQGALAQIQRNLRLMYVHAYQSYIWNIVAGKRWGLFGDKVVEGDLVVVGEKEREEGITNGTPTTEPELDENGEPIILPSASAPADGEAEGAVVGVDDPFVRARPLSQAEADSGRYSTADLVLPLPGYDVVYPQNDCGKFYETFMGSELGGGLDPHNMRRGWKDISLSGGYRKLMARPLGDGAKAEIKAYSGDDEQLVDTDIIGAKQPAEAVNGHASADSDKLAVIVRLQLASSQYATLALRELTKGGASAFVPDYVTGHRK